MSLDNKFSNYGSLVPQSSHKDRVHRHDTKR